MNNFLWIWTVIQLVFISSPITTAYYEETHKKNPDWNLSPQHSFKNLTLGETQYLISSWVSNIKTFFFESYDVLETTNKLSQSLRESLLTNPLIQERGMFFYIFFLTLDCMTLQ
jgi:hypothetical protein